MEGIQQALNSPHVGRKWVREFISGMAPDDIKLAVDTKFDPVTSLISTYSLDDPSIRPFATALLRRHWKDIANELKSVPRIINRLSENPVNKKQLDKPETIQYLNELCVRAYHVFYEYAWTPVVDLKCAYCGNQFPYDILLVVGMDFSGEDGGRYRIVVCPTCGKKVQAVF